MALGRNLGSRRRWPALAVVAATFATMPAVPAAAERILRLDDALEIARERSPRLARVRADEARAAAAVRTARQYANPRVVGMGGRLEGRRSGVNDGDNIRVTLNQPIESPFARIAERRASDAALAVAGAATKAAEAELVARVKLAFSQAVLAEQLRVLSEEQLELLSRVREGIARKVEVGEGPGLDLARAETEVLKARRDLAAAKVGVSEAELSLRAAIGDLEGEAIQVEGALPPFDLPPLEVLLEDLYERSPLITQARLDIDRAHHEVDFQKQLRLAGFGFQAEWEREPDDDKVLLGLRIPLPVWNRRGGEIAEAEAGLARARALLSERELSVALEVQSLYNARELAREQLTLIEQGMLEEAQRAVRGAEVAYRSGERGILEYLDAQRTLRQIQLDLVTARGDMERASIEIERLAGSGG